MHKKRKKMNPYKKVLIIMTLLFFIFMSSGITLSYISTNNKKQVDAIVFNEGDLAITFFDGNKINLEFPSKSNYRYQFSVTNTGSNKIYYSVYVKDVEVYDSNIRINLINDSKEEIYNEKLKKGENLIESVIELEPNKTDRYTININNKNNKSSIKGLIYIQNESLDNESFQDVILNDNIINNKTKTDIGTISKENEGLIRATDDYGTTYYYRGNVDNNYVKIGNLNFRIIRINGDGTVRLILDDNIEETYPFINSLLEDKNNSVLFENSSIKDELYSWLNNNLFDYTDLFVASNFCTDSSFEQIKDDIKYSNNHYRIENGNYTFSCYKDSYLSKIGFISTDEIIFAGGSVSENNNKYYLYNPNITKDTWTVSSYSSKDEVKLYTLTSSGKLGNNSITDKSGIRPVINIGVKARVTGQGTKENPYVIVK